MNKITTNTQEEIITTNHKQNIRLLLNARGLNSNAHGVNSNARAF